MRKNFWKNPLYLGFWASEEILWPWVFSSVNRKHLKLVDSLLDGYLLFEWFLLMLLPTLHPILSLEMCALHDWSAPDIFEIFSFLFHLLCLFRLHFERTDCPSVPRFRNKHRSRTLQNRPELLGGAVLLACRRCALWGSDLIWMPSTGPKGVGWMFLLPLCQSVS